MSDGREGCGERLWEFGLLTALRRALRGLIRLLAVAFAVLVGSFVSIDIAGAGSAIYATSGHSYDTHAEVAPAHAALGIAATVSGTPAGVLGPSAESAGAPLRLSGELVAPTSALDDGSVAAFRAADDPASIFIKNKHLATAGGNHAKFASTSISEVQGWVAQGLRSDGVQFLPNQLDGTFRAIVPAGQVVGTKGQTSIRVIVTGDGRVINAFPVNAR